MRKTRRIFETKTMKQAIFILESRRDDLEDEIDRKTEERSQLLKSFMNQADKNWEQVLGSKIQRLGIRHHEVAALIDTLTSVLITKTFT